MNNKIFNFLTENLQKVFSLPKYSNITIDKNTIVDNLP